MLYVVKGLSDIQLFPFNCLLDVIDYTAQQWFCAGLLGAFLFEFDTLNVALAFFLEAQISKITF